jgi:hypothetical protein
MADMTYTQLVKAITTFEKLLLQDAERIRSNAEAMDQMAGDTAREADVLGALAVDPFTVAEAKEVAKVLRGVGTAVLAYSAAGNTTARVAAAAAEQARTTHAGIKEQVGRAPVDITGVNREFLRQE